MKRSIEAELRDWYARQWHALAQCFGKNWPLHQAWAEEALNLELERRLLAGGWKQKRAA